MIMLFLFKIFKNDMRKLSTNEMEEIWIYFSLVRLFRDFSNFRPHVNLLFFSNLLSPLLYLMATKVHHGLESPRKRFFTLHPSVCLYLFTLGATVWCVVRGRVPKPVCKTVKYPVEDMLLVSTLIPAQQHLQ